MFYTDDAVFCPNCEPRDNKRGDRVGVEIACTEKCYSGHSVDVGTCPECHKSFFVSYKIDEITEIK